jgi:hypothetical protein
MHCRKASWKYASLKHPRVFARQDELAASPSLEKKEAAADSGHAATERAASWVRV